MLFFQKKKLFVGSDAMEFARVKSVLEQNHIQYDVKTTATENVLSRNFNAKAAERMFQPYSKFSVQSFLYTIYVKKSDYAKAYELAFSKKAK